MNTLSNTTRVLGVAFLLQFVTSFLSGSFLSLMWNVPGNIRETMANIAAKPWLFELNILVDMLTAFGVVFLGATLFITLQKHNKTMALVALGFYIVEGGLLAASKLSAYSLLLISQEYASAGQLVIFQSMANIALESMNFLGSTLHMLAFCLGGILFYYLLNQSGIVPRPLSLWGFITVFPCLIGTLLTLFGYVVPFALYIPYVPFEFVIGIWILVKGIKVSPARASTLHDFHGAEMHT